MTGYLRSPDSNVDLWLLYISREPVGWVKTNSQMSQSSARTVWLTASSWWTRQGEWTTHHPSDHKDILSRSYPFIQSILAKHPVFIRDKGLCEEILTCNISCESGQSRAFGYGRIAVLVAFKGGVACLFPYFIWVCGGVLRRYMQPFSKLLQ